jgi:UDPglucose--hexose-1-phosphate uridylyltransferase
VQALVNEGAAAGASLAHSHSQLVWLREEPPVVAAKRRVVVEAGECLLCRVLDAERKQRVRIVAERDGLLLLCPFAGRCPYEMLVAPLACRDDPFKGGGLSPALALVAEGARRLRVAEGVVAFNVWLHAPGHWHFEIVPRLTLLAGLELGAGYYVNTVAPESAAGILREA